MTWLLDTNIVSYFVQARREVELAAAAKHCPMAMVDEVRRELEQGAPAGAAFQQGLEGLNIEVRSIVVGSPAHIALTRLVNPASPAKDRGERASIALAAADASLTFVTHDKNGMWIALREIWAPGERIVGLVVFLRRLFEQGALTDPTALDDVVHVARCELPTWWASWRAELSPSLTER